MDLDLISLILGFERMDLDLSVIGFQFKGLSSAKNIFHWIYMLFFANNNVNFPYEKLRRRCVCGFEFSCRVRVRRGHDIQVASVANKVGSIIAVG